MEECIFCKIISGDIPSAKIFEDEDVYAFLDIHPVNTGHALVIPKKHSSTFIETPDDVLQKLVVAVKKIAPAILKAVEADACNIMLNNGRAAGQVVFHTHFHIVPRFPTDDLKLWPGRDEHQAFDEIAEKIKKEL